MLTALLVSIGVLGWPVLLALGRAGSFEIIMIDVGQGDAIALRSPKGRWVLVDAGPPSESGRAWGDGEGKTSQTAVDPGAHPVVRTLRAEGVGRLELLVLTHPDLDHIGGAEAVLRSFGVGRVLDPALPAPKGAYVDVLTSSRALGVPWSAARAGQSLVIDGVTLEVLHPGPLASGEVEANAASVVLLVRWRGFRALLTGDAYVDVERALVDEVGDLDVLKVGHHGSRTSTDSLFLARSRPEIALIPVGRRNRYGHPAPEVVRRLNAAGADVWRTDRHGTVRVRVARDGTVHVRPDRAAPTRSEPPPARVRSRAGDRPGVLN